MVAMLPPEHLLLDLSDCSPAHIPRAAPPTLSRVTSRPLTSLPTPRTPDPQDAPPLRWGIAGTGGIAANMVGAMQQHSRQQVVAVASRQQQTADAFAEKLGVERPYAGLEQMLADDTVDAVYIASPHSEHHAQALAAVAAGKHILVEKAFTRNAAEARAVVAAARAQSVTALEAMWTRFLPHIDILRQLLADGALGALSTVAADHGQSFDEDPDFRLFNPELAGGALLDLGIYPISFSSFVAGTPQRILAIGDRAFTGVDGQVSMLLQGEPGTSQSVINTNLFARTETTASIVGRQARVFLASDFYAPTTLTYRHRDGSELSYDGGAIRGHLALVHEAAHLAQLVADGRTESPLLPLDETISILETIDEVRRQLGVTLPGE